MQKLKELTAALMLLAVLALPVVAGEIHIPGPPPPPAATEPGDIRLPGVTQGPSAAVTEAALNLLQELLLVF
ncbi:MAG TPA: hypothetical protein VN643_22355 [Pyrinomonadaceae bacterium]|nr:hypothetical protein [Pyrinomonadaceae bacterium]